jgi:hypothetical protein
MAEIAAGLLADSAVCGIVYASKSAYCAAGKTDLTLTIDNQLKDVSLTLPLLFIDGCKRVEDPKSEIAPQTSTTAKFKKKATSSELKGALIYELHRASEDPYKFYVFVAWQASCYRSTRIYTRLLFDRADAISSIDRLEDIYQKLSDQLIKTHDDYLIQSYTFPDGAGIGLKSHCTGKKHRELYLTITDSVSKEGTTQILWIGPNVDMKDSKSTKSFGQSIKEIKDEVVLFEKGFKIG